MALAAVSSTLIISIISVLVAVVGIAIGAFFARKQLSRKRLSYSQQVTQLVNVHSEAKDRIKIFFGERQIQQAHLIEIGLKNTGNRPIKESDFERPLTVDLGGGFAMTAEIAEVNPPELKPEVVLTGTADRTGIQLRPLLLNPGDSLTLKVLARDFRGEVHFDYRIVGVNELTDVARQQAARSRVRRFIEPFIAGVVSVVAAAVIVGGLSLFRSDSDDAPTDNRPIYRERASYIPSCPDPLGCASPLGLLEHGLVTGTPNVLVGRTASGRRDPLSLTMGLRGEWRSAIAFIRMPTQSYSTMAAAVAVSSDCPGEAKAKVIVRADGQYIRSQVLTHPGGPWRFQVMREYTGQFELQARSLTRCALQVLWSKTEFR